MKKLIVLTSLLAMVACKGDKKVETKAAPVVAPEVVKPAAEPAKVVAAPPAEPAAADKAVGDFIHISISHLPAKPGDPVLVKFPKFEVVSAKFDPTNLDGATAKVEIDLASLDSASADRDKHLNTPDFFDVAKFAKATVVVSDVKQSDEGDNAYNAKLTVDMHGKSSKWDIGFTVVKTVDKSVTVALEHDFKRSEFAVGAPEAKGGLEDAVKAKAQLTFTMK